MCIRDRNTYLPMGFSNFKIEGRGLGSAMILEFLLSYMTKPQYKIHVRELEKTGQNAVIVGATTASNDSVLISGEEKMCIRDRVIRTPEGRYEKRY